MFEKFNEIRDQIFARQSAKLDEHLFNWLAEQGYSFQRTTEGVKQFLEERNFELQSNLQVSENGDRVFTYKLMKVVTSTKVVLKTPEITIDHG